MCLERGEPLTGHVVGIGGRSNREFKSKDTHVQKYYLKIYMVQFLRLIDKGFSDMVEMVYGVDHPIPPIVMGLGV